MTYEIPSHVQKIIRLLKQNGATDALLVGGWVRDVLLNIPSKDYDIEVYGLSYAQIKDILSPSFHVDLVGQSFGVLKVGRDVDVALPRRESKSGLGHKGFSVESVPDLKPEEAFARRDFTINAIGMRLDGSFCDPFDGIGDIKRRILRATGPAFKDDPLRVLRGMQFSARFGFDTDSQTLSYCREVLSEFSTLSQERIYEEWKKWALKGEYPEKGLEFLRNCGWVTAFPQLNALIDCPQNPLYHPEGDVWTHTLAVCREIRNAIRSFDLETSDDETVSLLFAALAHDFGKPQTTKLDEQGTLRALGHEQVGAEIAREFYRDMRAPIHIVDTVVNLTREHMTNIEKPNVKNVRRLARRLSPATVKLWILLRRADVMGRGGYPDFGFTEESTAGILDASLKRELVSQKVNAQLQQWMDMSREMNILDAGPEPVVLGRHLIQLGVEKGPKMGKILKLAFEAQLDDEFSTVEEGIEYVKKSGWIDAVS